MAKDKKLHFIAGMIISAITALVCYFILRPIMPNFGFIHNGLGCGFAGALMACVGGLIKEIRDLQGHGTPEVADFFFTAFGGILIIIPFAFF